MKKIFTLVILALSMSSFAQTTFCYDAPDGIDNTWTGGWSYKEFIIPVGYKIDSVYGDFDRNGYPENEYDFIFSVCLGTTVFGETDPTSPFNYLEINSSLYDTWIDLTSFEYTSVGVVRVYLPLNAGAVWNNLCIAISPITDNTHCFNTPDGIETEWSGGWSYLEYVIPDGYKIDSIFGDFDRHGYPENEEDFVFAICLGTNIYGETDPVSPFNYQDINISLYDRWIDLTSFNYSSIGVARVFLPINAGAIWNSFCFAISPISNRAFDIRHSKINAYPNPVSQTLYLTEKTDFTVYSLDGKKLFSGNSSSLDVSEYAPGIYIIKFINNSEQNILRFVKE